MGSPVEEHEVAWSELSGGGLSAIEKLDTTRANFFDQAARYYRMPHGLNLRSLQNSTQIMADSFSSSASTILATPEIELDDRLRDVVGLIKAEDRSRVDFFNLLSGDDEYFKPNNASPDEAVDFMRDAIESGADSLSVAMHMYLTDFSTDLDKMIDRAKATAYGRVLETASAIGQHALDISKLAAGVGLGVWLATRKKKST